MITRLAIGLVFINAALATTCLSQQLYKHYEVPASANVQKVMLSLYSKTGACFLEAQASDKPVEVYGKTEKEIATSSFKSKFYNGVKEVDVNLATKDHYVYSVTEAMAKNIFGNDESQDIWKVMLTENTPFYLDLNYVIGKANIDLSKISAQRLKINSGSADVEVFNKSGVMNPVEMDTFFVKVDLGSIVINDLNLTRAEEIIAEVGFGSILLDFGSEWKKGSNVTASVGAGNMIIKLPDDSVPMLVEVSDSPLCHIKLGPKFKKLDENKFANAAYQENSSGNIHFKLDVGMGRIAFESN